MTMWASKTWVAAAFAVVCASGLTAERARAWDPQADRLVADLAYARLTPAVKARVDQIIAQAGPIGQRQCRVQKLADAARLADCLHGDSSDFMKGVGYDPIPICGDKADTRPCPNGECASQVLRRTLQTLKAANADPQATPKDRLLALETVTYLIAEMHQPLHAADNGDRSGGRVRVALPGSSDRRLNLYSVWDQDFVAEAIGAEDTGLPYLTPLADLKGADWAQGDPDSWTSDTHNVAVADVYGRLPVQPPCGKAPDQPEVLDRAYVGAAAQAIREQLAKAGVRLAAALNAALG